MYSRILVPIDGSPTAQRGFQEAVSLAKRLDASLVLLYVVDAYPMMMEMATATTWERIADGLREAGGAVLDAARREAIEQKVACEAILEDVAAARVADVILEQARSRHCELIVMGTHGRRGIGRALLGSDAELVLRQSPIPVLLVREPVADSSR
jgi:nucleotide-binding universal stress UspA family protein